MCGCAQREADQRGLLVGRVGDVEDLDRGVGDQRLGRVVDRGDGVALGDALGPRPGARGDGDHREARLRVGGEVALGHDHAGADRADPQRVGADLGVRPESVRLRAVHRRSSSGGRSRRDRTPAVNRLVMQDDVIRSEHRGVAPGITSEYIMDGGAASRPGRASQPAGRRPCPPLGPRSTTSPAKPASRPPPWTAPSTPGAGVTPADPRPRARRRPADRLPRRAPGRAGGRARARAARRPAARRHQRLHRRRSATRSPGRPRRAATSRPGSSGSRASTPPGSPPGSTRLDPEVQGLALVALDHPLVREAIRRLAGAGRGRW